MATRHQVRNGVTALEPGRLEKLAREPAEAPEEQDVERREADQRLGDERPVGVGDAERAKDREPRTSIAVSGTISETKEAATSARAVRGGSRVIANPAHDATSTESGTTSAATRIEFSVYRARSTRSNAWR